jgi:branched-chain amino acid transport system substrate-binding protein
MIGGCERTAPQSPASTQPGAQGTAGAKVVAIGAISPFTGDGAPYGKAARTGIDLAVDEINAQGGIKGMKLAVVYEDDQGTPTGALSAFEKLVTIDKVPAILGPFYSGNVLAVAPKANERKVVLITGSATSDNIRDAGDYVFRTCPSNDAQAKTIAEFAADQLKLRTAFVIYRNVEYGVTLRDAFSKAAQTFHLEITGSEAVPADSRDVRAQVSQAKAANPDFIFAAVHYPEGGTFLRQAKELGVSAVLIGTDGGFDPQLFKIAGDAAEGSYWVTIGWGEEKVNPTVADFKTAYRKRYGEDPGVYSGLYYDAIHVLAKALTASPVSDGPGVQKALTAAEYDGPTGRTKFDSAGDVNKPFAIYRVESGRFVYHSRQPTSTSTGGRP